jgi:predicted sugar kinase
MQLSLTDSPTPRPLDVLLLLQHVRAGFSEMETANWDAAIQSFGQTLHALQREEPGSSREQRQAFAAHYLAAVMLLKAAGAGAGTKEAKLYR